jgi:hypothetical protein
MNLAPLALLACLACLPACSAGPWQRAVEHESRRGEAYQEIWETLQVEAVRLTPDMLVAEAQELCAARACTLAEAEAAEQQARRASTRAAVFVLAVYTREPGWNDLDRPDSRWRVTLASGATQAAPSEIKPLKRRDEWQRLYPALDPLHAGYRVTFPLPSDPDQVRLTVSGLLGKVSLEWTRTR